MKNKNSEFEYKPFDTWIWKTFERKPLPDLNTWIIENMVEEDYEKKFFIGTDSQVYGKLTQYATAIVCLEDGRGGKAAIHTAKYKTFETLRPRMLQEARMSLEAAWVVDKIIPREIRLKIDLDLNDDPFFESGKYREELVGYVVAQGYECSHKPNSFASSSVADKRC